MNGGLTVGELNVLLGLDDSQFDRKLAEDEAKGRAFSKKHIETKADIDIRPAQTKMGILGGLISSNTERMQSMGMKMSMGVTLPVMMGMGFAVKGASDLEESLNKINVVFGDQAKAITAWSEDSAKAMGQSQQQALEAAGTYGNLFIAMGNTEEASAEMSMTLTELASDLASFNNTSVDEAIQALRSGMVGETEPLKRFGVAMNEDTIKAKALAMGLQWTGQTLPPLIKQQAVYAMILEQTTTAQGDFANTADGLANSTKIAWAEVKNMAAAFGKDLIPIAKDALSVIKPVVEGFTGLPDPIRKTILVFAGLGAVIGPAMIGLAMGIKAFREIRGIVQGISSWMKTGAWTAETTAINANTGALERNAIARQGVGTAATGTAGAMRSSTAAAGAIGTGTGGMGAGGAPAASGGGAWKIASVAMTSVAIAGATIGTIETLGQAWDAWGEMRDAEGQRDQMALDRAANLGRLIGSWRRDNPGEALPPEIKKLLDEFMEEKGNSATTADIKAVEKFEEISKLYNQGSEAQIAAYKAGLAKEDENTKATDGQTEATEENTAATAENTAAQTSSITTMAGFQEALLQAAVGLGKMPTATDAVAAGQDVALQGLAAYNKAVAEGRIDPSTPNPDNPFKAGQKGMRKLPKFAEGGIALAPVGGGLAVLHGEEEIRPVQRRSLPAGGDDGGREKYILKVIVTGNTFVGTSRDASKHITRMVNDTLGPRAGRLMRGATDNG